MQLKSRLKATKAEIADMKTEQARVREELAISLEELQRELKLRSGDRSTPYITMTTCNITLIGQ